MIEAGKTIKWIHPDNGEEYYFTVAEAEHHGCGHWTITLKDGRSVDVWEYDLDDDHPFKVTEEQINPPDEPETRYGRLR